MTGAERPDLAVVVTSHNTRDLLRGCLQSLHASQGVEELDIWVVDDVSTDGSADMVRAEFPAAHLIETGANVGFSGSNNLALREILRAPRPPRLVLLLNADTVVPPGALREMVDLFDRYPAVGAAGPRLHLADGKLDWACKRGFPSPAASLYHLTRLGSLFPRSRRFGRYRLTYLDERAVADVDSVVGAFMMVRLEVVAQVGLLDERFFMYGEDLDWAFRIKQAGWRVLYNGQVDVLHLKKQSTRQNRRAQRAFYESMLIFFRKHYARSTPWPARVAIEAGVRGLTAAAALRQRARATEAAR
jgi:N-acetylglucosaminyl-diphospho-decaprenol L-rhamnosyltransferase